VEVELTNVLVVAAVAFGAPLALGLLPRLRLPAIVLELLAGILLGPAGLGWVQADDAVEILALLGLAFLLFLAGLEIEVHRLRGRVLRVALLAFGLSFALALGAGLALDLVAGVGDPLFVAIALAATSLGVVVPVLKDSGEIGSRFGQLVVAGSTIADFATILLLSLLFSRDATSTTTQVLLVAGLFATAALVGLALAEVERHLGPVRRALRRLQDTTAQIRVRGAFVLVVALCALAGELGLELILGAFLAGAVLTVVDRDEQMTHPDLRRKLEAVGFGVFIPAFFVTSGLRYDLDALLEDPATLALVPAVLLALLVVRGVPALLYRPLVEPGRVPVAALLQATSLPFIVAATAIGVELGVIAPAVQAALIAAGLLSVVAFPATALALLRHRPAPGGAVATAPEAM